MPESTKTHPDKQQKPADHKPGKGNPPAAGPHAKPELTDTSKTPGSGLLPDPHKPQEGDATSG
ncbi:hypothetical protein ACLBXM_18220 [Xanthobacteraceae bacterium A53D]